MGKKLSDKQIKLIEERLCNWSVGTLAKQVGMTKEQLVAYLKGQGITIRDLYGYLTPNELALCLQVDSKSITRWIEELGLKARKIGLQNKTYKRYYIDIDDFWEFAEKNKSLINFFHLEKNILGIEPEWVAEERKKGFVIKNKRSSWTKETENTLVRMFYEGKTHKEISLLLHRTEASCRKKLYQIRQEKKRVV